MERLTQPEGSTQSFATLPTPRGDCGRLPSGRRLLGERDREGSLPDGDPVFWHTGGRPARFSADGAPTAAMPVKTPLPDAATTMEFA